MSIAGATLALGHNYDELAKTHGGYGQANGVRAEKIYFPKMSMFRQGGSPERVRVFLVRCPRLENGISRLLHAEVNVFPQATFPKSVDACFFDPVHRWDFQEDERLISSCTGVRSRRTLVSVIREESLEAGSWWPMRFSHRALGSRLKEHARSASDQGGDWGLRIATSISTVELVNLTLAPVCGAHPV